MGYAVRTDRYRYTEWRKGNEVIARELYDHAQDPGENTNVAHRPENHGVMRQLQEQLSRVKRND